MNHSCRPNCDVFQRGDALFVYALNAIARGEEITISYEPNIRKMLSTKERRSFMLKEFGFLCCCQECLHNQDEAREELEDMVEENAEDELEMEDQKEEEYGLGGKG